MLKYRLWRIKKSFTSQTEPALKYRRLNIEIEQRSTKIMNLVGYVILLLVLLDYAFLLVPPNFFNPTWAYNTAGNFIESVWGLLLGLLLIFYRRDQDIVKPKESFILKIISWSTLLIGITYFLIAPLILTNSFRIHRDNKAQITNQLDYSTTQIEQYSQQLNGASKEQLGGLLQNYQQNSPEVEINSPQELKNKLIAEAKQKQQTSQKEIKTKFSQQKKALFKTTVKWLIGAVVSGMCFIMIWKHTQWARIR